MESVSSLIPLVDEMVICVGDSTDDTEKAVEVLARQFPEKLKVVKSPWDSQKTSNGEELARQTNIALAQCRHNICFYLQADEVLDEKEYPTIAEDLARFAVDDALDTLLFRWVHFYGSYFSVIYSKRWYRREIRVIKKDRGLRSFGDAQSFRIWDERTKGLRKSRAALSRAHVLHYGWAKEETLMREKFRELGRYWGKDPALLAPDLAPVYHHEFGITSFVGAHPAVMQARAGERPVAPARWMSTPLRRDFRYWRFWVTDVLEKLFGWRPGEFRSYRSLKKF